MFILLFFACSCNIFSMDSPIPLGQSPRSAHFIKQTLKTTDWWISGSIQPVTMRYGENELRQIPQSVDGQLITYCSISWGSTYHMHKNIDIVGSIGLQAQTQKIYIPILYEAHWQPIQTTIKPYLFIGLGSMISQELLFFASRGFGIKAKVSDQVSVDLQYRQHLGDVFFFEPYVPLREAYFQHGIQASVLISM